MSLIPQGRLTATSGQPLQIANNISVTALYYTPYVGNIVPIWSTSEGKFNDVLFSELSIVLDSNSSHTGYQSSGSVRDVAIILVGGVPKLATGVAWADIYTLGTGSGTAEREFINGVWVNKVPQVFRYGTGASDVTTVPAREATIVSAPIFSANGATRFVPNPTPIEFGRFAEVYFVNIYNQVPYVATESDTGGTSTVWTWNTTGTRAANGSTSNSIWLLNPLSTGAIYADYTCYAEFAGGTTGLGGVSIGLDSPTIPTSPRKVFKHTGSGTMGLSLTAECTVNPGLGFHAIYAQDTIGGTAMTVSYVGGPDFMRLRAQFMA